MSHRLLAPLLALLLGLAITPARADYSIAQPQCIAYLGSGEIGQSFLAAGPTGRLSSVAFVSDVSNSATLRIHAGSGYGGALLHEQAVTYVASPGTLQQFPLTTPPVLTSGQTYTLRLLTASGVVGLCGTNTNPYPGGMLIDGTQAFVPSQDLAFNLSVDTTTGACGPAAGVPSLTAPASGLCSFGASSGVITNPGNFQWTCAATQCNAPRAFEVGNTIVGNGSLAPSGTQVVPFGQQASVVVTPAVGHEISSVTGCGGSLAGSTYTTAPVTSACTITATFGAIQLPITVTPTAGGSVACTPNPVPFGSDSTCVATPDPGQAFDGWVAGCSGSVPSCTLVSLTAPVTVEAAFATIVDGSCGAANGVPRPSAPTTGLCATGLPSAVSTSPPAFAWTCAGTAGGDDAQCSAPRSYRIDPLTTGDGILTPTGTLWALYGTTPTFVPVPDPGNELAQIDGCGGTLVDNAYTVAAIVADCVVHARFDRIDYVEITVVASEGGSVACTPSMVPHGGDAVCTATPDAGYLFGAWVSGCVGDDPDCTLVNVVQPLTVQAGFVRIHVPIGIAPAVGGSVACTPNPVPHGDAAACTATPEAGYRFDAWVAGCVGDDADCVIENITAPVTVQAGFARLQLPITVLAAEGGTVACTPNPVSYGDDVACIATPDAGYGFVAWIAGCVGNDATCALVDVTTPVTVQASFAATVDGRCGAAAGVASRTAPTANLCTAGSASAVTTTAAAFAWSCPGESGGDDAQCSAPRAYELQTAIVGNGSVTPAGPVLAPFGSAPVFTAVPGNGQQLEGIEGCGGTLAGDIYTVAPVANDCSVRLRFVAVALDVTVLPGDGGTVACTPTPLLHGGTLTCTATPDAGHQFDAWGGDCSGTAPVCVLAAVTAAVQVQAAFVVTGATAPLPTVVPVDAWWMLLLLAAALLALGVRAVRH